ncbi:MAG: hypothetical protein ACI865_002953 [Flavobacteriaceae bacterium]|jgi:hypothetical protein
MTQKDLDNLFNGARTIQTTTTVDEVSSWLIGATALSATVGSTSIISKLKLLTLKKGSIMLQSTFGIVTISLLIMTGTNEKVKQNEVVGANTEVIQVIEKEPALVEAIQEVKPIQEQTSKETNSRIPEAVVSMDPISRRAFSFVPINLSIGAALSREMAPVAGMLVGGKRDRAKIVKGDGNVIKVNREVSPFNELCVSGVMDIIIMQGETESVEVEIDENLQDKILLENKGSKLYLGIVSGTKMKNPTVTIIHVTVKDISKLVMDGVGNVIFKSFKTDEFELIIEGVGGLELGIDCAKLKLDSYGVGDVHLTGNIETGDIDCSGIGDVIAYDASIKSLKLN